MTEEQKKIKLLVIDDHPFFGANLKYKLAPYGFEVIEAESGTIGILKAKNFKPQIILVDYIMPQMDGIETIQKLSKDPDLANTYIMMYTSEAYPQVIKNSIKAGAKDFILKTSPLEKILEKLNKITEEMKNEQ